MKSKVLTFGAQICLIFAAILSMAAMPVHAQETSEFVTVKLEQGTSLRQIAQKHLKNPDLWPIILKLNGLDNVLLAPPNTQLRIPTDQVKLSAEALEASLEAIQGANTAGAQLFAPVTIQTAIEFRDKAVVENNKGSFDQSILHSSDSIINADLATEKSKSQRDVAAEARLSDRHGFVEGQKSEEFSWSERQLNAILIEQEKLRTLSQSTAQVVFRDASRLRLNPNSQAVIQQMRTDPLKRREEAKISLVEGDFYALLGSESKRSRLEVTLPNADAKIDSGNFWVSQDASTAKFSNFDIRPVEISAQGETLILGRNEGAIVQAGQAPRTKINVLDRIELSTPADDEIVFGSLVDLAWQEAAADGGYWLEVAHDQRFDKMANSLWAVKENKVGNLEVSPGKYYWRVAALDGFGLPGQMSTVRSFNVQTDTVPPFLRIIDPKPNAIIRKANVTIKGETESDATITIDGKPIAVNSSGRFTATVEATSGANEIEINVTDLAGNVTARKIGFSVIADNRREIKYDDAVIQNRKGQFLSAADKLTISGKVVANAKIVILDDTDQIRSETYTADSGSFVLNIPLLADEENLRIQITTVSGYRYEEPIQTMILRDAPIVRLAKPLPRVTSQKEIELIVELDQAATVTANGQSAAAGTNPASFVVPLKQGSNLVEIVATNQVGLVTIVKRSITYDSKKPEITSQNIEVAAAGNKDRLTMLVGAKDASGLAKTSRFKITGGSKEYTGYLRFNRIKKRYQGFSDIIRNNDKQKLKIEIEIVDVAGNINKLELIQ